MKKGKKGKEGKMQTQNLELNKMEVKKRMGTIIRKSCRYCHKEFESLYENQVDQWIEMHERYCKMNPNREDNGKPSKKGK